LNRFHLHLAAAVSLSLAGGLAHRADAQSKPNWKSYAQTGNAADIVPAPTVATQLGNKVDTSGGASTNQTLTTPSLKSGSVTGTDLTGGAVKPTGATGTITPGDWARNVLDVRAMGAKCDGSTDDSAAINAALALAHNTGGINGGVVLIPAEHNCKFGSTLVVPEHVTLTGAGIRESLLSPTSTSFSPLIQLTGGWSKVRDLEIDAGTPTSGVAIDASTDQPFGAEISRVWIEAPCIGIDLSGNSQFIDQSRVNNGSGASCYGIRVGHVTTSAGTTDPRITNTTVSSQQTAGAGMRIEDAGGLYLSDNDVLYGVHGTWIIPGASQQVIWTFGSNTVLSDTAYGTGLLIDTSASTAKVQGLSFVNSWVSNAQNAPGAQLLNTGGGLVTGIHILAGRWFTNGGDGVDVAPTVTDFSFEHSAMCGNNSSSSGIYLQSGMSGFRIEGNTITSTCNGASANFAYGINLGGSNAEGVVTGNDLTGLANPLAVTSPASSANLIIRDNIPTATQLASVADAATVGLGGGQENYTLTGSGTTITSMTPAWGGRKVTLYPAAAVAFGTGGNVCSAFTATAGVPVTASYFGCWYLK